MVDARQLGAAGGVAGVVWRRGDWRGGGGGGRERRAGLGGRRARRRMLGGYIFLEVSAEVRVPRRAQRRTRRGLQRREAAGDAEMFAADAAVAERGLAPRRRRRALRSLKNKRRRRGNAGGKNKQKKKASRHVNSYLEQQVPERDTEGARKKKHNHMTKLTFLERRLLKSIGLLFWLFSRRFLEW